MTRPCFHNDDDNRDGLGSAIFGFFLGFMYFSFKLTFGLSFFKGHTYLRLIQEYLYKFGLNHELYFDPSHP